MHRYASNAAARADELLDLLGEEQLDLVSAWLRQNMDKELLEFILTPSERVQRLVGQTPAKDRKWVEKTARPTFLREWLAARHWAIAAAKELRIAEALYDTPGLGYRQAVERAVPIADEWLDQPSTEDLLLLRMAD